MKGSETKLLEYMEGAKKRFVIPVYQRNYDWRTDNCKQLFDDLKKVIRSNRKSHFFGSIVSVYNPDGDNMEFQIIDGQQRLTTISLLLLAMYNLLKNGVVNSAQGNLADKILRTYLIDEWQEDETRIKLKPVKNDLTAKPIILRIPTSRSTTAIFTIASSDRSCLWTNCLRRFAIWRSSALH